MRLGEGLRGHGWTVSMASLTESGDDRTVPVEPITTVSSSAVGRFDRRVARALARRIAEFGPDVILANGGSTLRYAALVARRLGLPLGYIAIGEPRYWIRSALSRRANRWMLRRVDQVFAVCRATRDQLLELEPSLAGRIQVAYTGVPSQMFVDRRERAAGPLRVVMLGSLSEEKDPFLALEAVAGVPEAVLRLVGDGPLRAGLEEEIEARGLRQRVDVVGSVDDVLPQLAWADVLILTSHTEGLPGAVLEAGAASVAVLAVDVGGVRDAVVDGVTGLVVPPGDLGALVAGLTGLASDLERTSRMGAAANRHIEEHFALADIVAGYASGLEEMLG